MFSTSTSGFGFENHPDHIRGNVNLSRIGKSFTSLDDTFVITPDTLANGAIIVVFAFLVLVVTVEINTFRFGILRNWLLVERSKRMRELRRGSRLSSDGRNWCSRTNDIVEDGFVSRHEVVADDGLENDMKIRIPIKVPSLQNDPMEEVQVEPKSSSSGAKAPSKHSSSVTNKQINRLQGITDGCNDDEISSNLFVATFLRINYAMTMPPSCPPSTSTVPIKTDPHSTSHT
jgi:hypothetical protein